MLALIYLALAIYLGDLLCRRFYRFVSTPHRWAAATVVGILLSTWFTYLVRLALAHTSEPLLWADLLFFVVTSGVIFLLSRKAPRISTITPRPQGTLKWDWITLGALFAATCVLLIGTLSVNKQGTLRLYGKDTSDLARQLSIAQSVGLSRAFSTEFPQYASQVTQFLFFFQAGNLEFLGLNLAWSVDVLSVLVLTSTLALVMALGELLFNSRGIGRLGATLFFFHGSLRHLTNFLPSRHADRGETWRFWKQIDFVNQRHLPWVVGIFLLVLIFSVDRYRQGSLAARTISDALTESKQSGNWTQLKRGLASIFITRAKPVLTPANSFGFSGLLLAALPLWNAPLLIATAMALFCLFVAYASWWSSTVRVAAMPGRLLAGTLAAWILAAGVIDLWAVYSSSRSEVNYEKEPLAKGLGYRKLVVYKIPDSPVTAFEGGQGIGKRQFDSPRAIAINGAGNIFVADTNNGRIEQFSPNGTWVRSIGKFEAPNGIAIDHAGNIYVAEIGSKHRVQKLSPGGKFVAEWAPGLYGPRRIAIGPDDSIYVVDSGRNRIVRFSPNGQVLTSWGSEGGGDGEFKGLTSVAADPVNNKMYVADPINSRIQVFDLDGKFLTKWLVPEWGRPSGFEDIAIDSQRRRLYVSSANMNSILVFDLQGNRTGTLMPRPPDKLDSPSAVALAKNRLLVLNSGSARVSVIDLQNR